jgi:ferredoxin--NADP+ reductase
VPPCDPQNAVVVDRVDHHEALATFRIAYRDGRTPTFKPGQYATLGLTPPVAPPEAPPENAAEDVHAPPAKLVRRMYSVASPPVDRDHVSFYIVQVDAGALTPSLFDLQPGDTLYMAERFAGHFTLDPVPANHRIVCIGTGTGLAPFRSMYLTHRHDAPPRWDRFVLLDGCRTAADLAYHDELRDLAEQDERFVYVPTVTREPEGSAYAGRRGRVTDLLVPDRFAELAGFELDPATTSVLLCGNPAMIDQVEATLTESGFTTYHRTKNPTGTLHFERYW